MTQGHCPSLISVTLHQINHGAQ
ncbi:hypothetical protein Nmel_016946 [Mimus melanotis]